MLFRIASHSVRERCFIGFENRSVDGDPFVEVVHLLLEVGCMFVVYVRFLVRLLVFLHLHGATTGHKHLKMFRSINAYSVSSFGKSLAYNMRNSRYAIFILDSRSDGDRSGTFADVDFLKLPSGKVL